MLKWALPRGSWLQPVAQVGKLASTRGVQFAARFCQLTSAGRGTRVRPRPTFGLIRELKVT